MVGQTGQSKRRANVNGLLLIATCEANTKEYQHLQLWLWWSEPEKALFPRSQQSPLILWIRLYSFQPLCLQISAEAANRWFYLGLVSCDVSEEESETSTGAAWRGHFSTLISDGSTVTKPNGGWKKTPKKILFHRNVTLTFCLQALCHIISFR